jgi:hypothetical protein
MRLLLAQGLYIEAIISSMGEAAEPEVKRIRKRDLDEVKADLPSILGDWIFLASHRELQAACAREVVSTEGPRPTLLNRLVAAFAPPLDGVEPVRKGRALARDSNMWAVLKIRQLQLGSFTSFFFLKQCSRYGGLTSDTGSWACFGSFRFT